MLNTRQNLSGVAWQLLDHLSKTINLLFINALVARYLGPEEFGYYSLYMLIIGIGYPLVTLGTDIMIFKFFTNNPHAEIEDIGSIRQLRFFTSFVFGIATLCIAYYSVKISVFWLISIIAATLVVETQLVYRDYFVARRISSKFAISNVTGTWISAIIKLITIKIGGSLWLFAFADFIQRIVTYVLCLRLYSTKQISPTFRDEVPYLKLKDLVKSSLPFMLSTFAASLMLYTDQLVLSYFSSISDVGNYSAASKLVVAFYIIPTVLSNVTFPDLAKLYRQRNIEFLRSVTVLYRQTYLIQFAIISILYFFRFEIIAFVYGSDFILTAPIFSILSFTLIFVAANTFNTKILLLYDLGRFVLFRSIIGVVTNLILNVIFIQYFGAIGAAIATLISLIVVFCSPLLHNKTLFLMAPQTLGLVRTRPI